MKRLLVFATVILFARSGLADIIVGGITFNDNAFADVVVDASPLGGGQFAVETTSSFQLLNLPADLGILAGAVLGSDVSQWASLRTSQAQLTVGFTDVIPADGPGVDFAIVEIGATAQVAVTIGAVTQQFHSQPSGAVNMILVDLSSFGVLQTSTVTVSSSDIFNDIAAFRVINGVPEPSAIMLLGIGAVGLLFAPCGRRTNYHLAWQLFDGRIGRGRDGAD